MMSKSAFNVVIVILGLSTLDYASTSHHDHHTHRPKIQKKHHHRQKPNTTHPTSFLGKNRRVTNTYTGHYIPGNYKLISESAGKSFFDDWDFFTDGQSNSVLSSPHQNPSFCCRWYRCH